MADSTTPPRRTQEERTALSDQRMRASAIKLMVDVGLKGMTLAAIGDLAGYSRGLVTHRFGSKAKLLVYVHDTVMAEWIGRVRDAVGTSTGVVALLKVVDVLHAILVEAPDEIRAMYLLRYASIDPGAEFGTSVAKAHRAQRRETQRWIEGGQAEGTVRTDIDAALQAELFCASIDGLIYRWLVTPKIPVRQLHDLLKQQVASFSAADRQP